MIEPTPFRWSNPASWPWVVYVWIAFGVIGYAKPLWKWFRRRAAESWPVASGTIESVDVRQATGIRANFARGNRPAFIGELAYSYIVEGQRLSGYYQRQVGTEEEGWQFIHDLKGKPVTIRYNPTDAAESLLPDSTVETLIQLRAPSPDLDDAVRKKTELPAWLKALLFPFVLLSATGLALSLWVHFGAVAGRKVAPDWAFFALHIGIFVVWFPAVMVAQRRVGGVARRDYWKAVLRGSPEWMRYMVYCFFAYAIVNFLVFVPEAPAGGSGIEAPPIVWRGFSGHWMAFYSAAFAILYSAVQDADES